MTIETVMKSLEAIDSRGSVLASVAKIDAAAKSITERRSSVFEKSKDGSRAASNLQSVLYRMALEVELYSIAVFRSAEIIGCFETTRKMLTT
jgi:hypothetical protein